MGQCGTKPKSLPKQQDSHEINKALGQLHEVDTNIGSGQKQGVQSVNPNSDENHQIVRDLQDNFVNENEEGENSLKSLKKLVSDEQIQQYLLGDDFNRKVIENKDVLRLVQAIPFQDNKSIMQQVTLFNEYLTAQEDTIYQLNRVYPSEILHNYQNLLMPQIIELSQEDLNLLRNPSIIFEALSLTCKTYHILIDLCQKEKQLKNYKAGGIEMKDQEQGISEELKQQYLKLQSVIKLELIRTFQKQAHKGSIQPNNPLVMMRFNTKHAITLAKQQTLKQKNADEKEEEDEDEDDEDKYQKLKSLYDTLNNGLEIVQKYDITSMKPSH